MTYSIMAFKSGDYTKPSHLVGVFFDYDQALHEAYIVETELPNYGCEIRFWTDRLGSAIPNGSIVRPLIKLGS
jgi:hypothetical protein